MGNKGEELEAKPSVVGLHYRLGRKIGEGSFGVIYEGMTISFSASNTGSTFVISALGIHMIDNRPIAIKFVPNMRFAFRTFDEMDVS